MYYADSKNYVRMLVLKLTVYLHFNIQITFHFRNKFVRKAYILVKFIERLDQATT